MLLEGRIIHNGMDIVRYLDEKLAAIKAADYTATGIIIGSVARKHLSITCQELMGQKSTKDDITVNRYHGVLLIEDGVNSDRVEVISAKAPTLPVEGSPFSVGLKRVRS